MSQERILKGYVCTQKFIDQSSYYLIGLGLPIPSPSYLATVVTLRLLLARYELPATAAGDGRGGVAGRCWLWVRWGRAGVG